MINIIKHGNHSASYILICPTCGCTFTFNRKDVFQYDNRISVDEWVTTYRMKCPECNDITYLGNDEDLRTYEVE